MPIAAVDFFRGAALSLVLGHPAFQGIKPLDPGRGRFLVNSGLHLWLRHSKEKSPWHFTFSPEDLADLAAELGKGQRTCLGLVCGRDAVCALDNNEIGQALALERAQEQTITVTRVPGRQCRVSGPGGEVSGLIPGNAFPAKLFG